MMSERNDATICAESKTDDSRSETENTQLNEAQKDLLQAVDAEDFKCAEKALLTLNDDEVIQALYVWKPDHTSLPIQFFVNGLLAAITKIKRAEPEAKPVSDEDFFDACRTGKESTVRKFIAQGGNINTYSSSGRNALLIASWFERWSVVRILLEAGASIVCVDTDRNFPLHLALLATFVPSDIVRGLMTRSIVDAETIEGATPLCFAAKKGHLTALRMLIEAGADPNHKGPDGWTPMCFALECGHTDCARELMRHGAKLELPPEEKEDSNA